MQFLFPFLLPLARGFIVAIIFVTFINLFDYLDKKFFSCEEKCKNIDNGGSNKLLEKDKQNIKTLTRQIARWANASQQDESPLVSLLHANYSAGYLWALQDIYNSKDVESATGENFNKLKNKITNIQDNATKKVLNVCPDFNKKLDLELAKLGGEGL